MKRCTLVEWLVIALLLAIVPTVIFAQARRDAHVTRLGRFCPQDLVRIPKEWVMERVPVGCEIVDCCPGCPGPGLLDWRIRVAGAPLEGVTLSFDRLPPEIAAKLQVRGSATMVAPGTLRVGQGETLIMGLPGEMGDRPPVGQMQLAFNKSWQPKLVAPQQRMSKAALQDSADEGAIDISIEQFLGNVRVNEYRLHYGLNFNLCPQPLTDRIDINNNASNDVAVELVDARRASGCVNDEVRRGGDIIGMGSVLSNGTCRSEVAVFSDDDAMQLLENVQAWTDPLGDTLPVDMTPDRLMAPVTVWVARASAQATAQADIDNANLLYNSNNVGIGFNVTFQDVTANQNALNTIGVGCANVVAVVNSAFFNANRLNVYYVNGAFTGVNCNFSRNVQYVGTTANNQTLAHEFGHSMSLDHTNGNAAFPTTNVMVGGGSGRTHFSEGQAFRLNAQCSSTINANAVRNGPVRNCADTIAGNVACPNADTHCPALALDVQPK